MSCVGLGERQAGSAVRGLALEIPRTSTLDASCLMSQHLYDALRIQPDTGVCVYAERVGGYLCTAAPLPPTFEVMFSHDTGTAESTETTNPEDSVEGVPGQLPSCSAQYVLFTPQVYLPPHHFLLREIGITQQAGGMPGMSIQADAVQQSPQPDSTMIRSIQSMTPKSKRPLRSAAELYALEKEKLQQQQLKSPQSQSIADMTNPEVVNQQATQACRDLQLHLGDNVDSPEGSEAKNIPPVQSLLALEDSALHPTTPQRSMQFKNNMLAKESFDALMVTTRLEANMAAKKRLEVRRLEPNAFLSALIRGPLAFASMVAHPFRYSRHALDTTSRDGKYYPQTTLPTILVKPIPKPAPAVRVTLRVSYAVAPRKSDLPSTLDEFSNYPPSSVQALCEISKRIARRSGLLARDAMRRILTNRTIIRGATVVIPVEPALLGDDRELLTGGSTTNRTLRVDNPRAFQYFVLVHVDDSFPMQPTCITSKTRITWRHHCTDADLSENSLMGLVEQGTTAALNSEGHVQVIPTSPSPVSNSSAKATPKRQNPVPNPNEDASEDDQDDIDSNEPSSGALNPSEMALDESFPHWLHLIWNTSPNKHFGQALVLATFRFVLPYLERYATQSIPSKSSKLDVSKFMQYLDSNGLCVEEVASDLDQDPSGSVLVPSHKLREWLQRFAESMEEGTNVLEIEGLVAQPPTGAASDAKQATASDLPSTDVSDIIKELISGPVLFTKHLKLLGQSSMQRGILLHGPPGVGKTYSVRKGMLAAAAAILSQLIRQPNAELCGIALRSIVESHSKSQLDPSHSTVTGTIHWPSLRLIMVDAPAILSHTPGESEARLRDIFGVASTPVATASYRQMGNVNSKDRPDKSLWSRGSSFAQFSKYNSALSLSAYATARTSMDLPAVDLSSLSLAFDARGDWWRAQRELYTRHSGKSLDPNDVVNALSPYPVSQNACPHVSLDWIYPIYIPGIIDENSAQPEYCRSYTFPLVTVLFFDEVESICPKRKPSNEGGSNAADRLVAQLLTLLDGFDNKIGTRGQNMGSSQELPSHIQPFRVVVGATNLPHALDPALRRPGRLDKELYISPPDANIRFALLKKYLTSQSHSSGSDNDTIVIGKRVTTSHASTIASHLVPISEDETDRMLALLSEITIGFVGADINALVREATLESLRQRAQLRATRLFGPLDDSENQDDHRIILAWEHFEAALLKVGASALRGHKFNDLQVKINNLRKYWATTTSTPFGLSLESGGITFDTTSASVGGLLDVKQKLQEAVEWPLRYKNTFHRLGLRPPRGVLMYGPPGGGKTSIVKALAQSMSVAFLTLSGAEVFSSYLGESERIVRELFAKARAAQPCVVFFDELDAIVTKRDLGDGGGGGEGATASMAARVLSTLLNEMDGVERAEGVLVIGATNRIDKIDAALLRPGRFDYVIHVPVSSDKSSILGILKASSRNMPLDVNVDLDEIATLALEHAAKRSTTPASAGLSGAKVASICREAAAFALRRYRQLCQGLSHDEQRVLVKEMTIKREDFIRAVDTL